MSEKVQLAIDATRNGDKREAQQLLADALEENPNDEHAWFLLGNLVDSPEKRKAYLGQALTINPHHEKARQQYSQVQHEIVSAPATTRITEVDTDDTDDTITPDQVDEAVGESAADDDSLELAKTLDVTTADTADEAETKLAPVATTVVTSPTSPKTDREKQLQRYNFMLGFLISLIAVVLILLLVL